MLLTAEIDNEVSIHAPAKGATVPVRLRVLRFISFNPRSREGSDMLPKGSADYRQRFNPRSREGSDTSRIRP